MDKIKYYKTLFIVGGIWNLLAAAPMCVLSFFDNMGLSALGLLYYQGFMILVVLYGIGYIAVGLNLSKNRMLVILGVIGKILVFIYFVYGYIENLLPITHLLVGIGDLIFALLFIEFLLKYQKE